MKRKITQISCTDYKIYALASDGTLWELNSSGAWSQHEPLPDAPDLERVVTQDPIGYQSTTITSLEFDSIVGDAWANTKGSVANMEYVRARIFSGKLKQYAKPDLPRYYGKS